MPANWTTIENALQAQVVRALGLAGAKVIWEGQKLPRPVKPFVTLQIEADDGAALPEPYQKNNPAGVAGTLTPTVTIGTELLIGTTDNAEFTLRVQAFTPEVIGTSCARALLLKVKNAFGADSYTDALFASGIAVIDRSTVLNLTDLLETKFEGRAALEIRCRVEDGHEETQTFIETVQITTTLVK